MSPAAPVLFPIVIILVVFIVVRERSRRVVVPSEPIEPTDPELLGHSCTIALGDEIVARAGTQTGGEELIVPIESREQRIGTITFRSHRAYDEHDRQFAELLARRVSAAIDNAHRPQEKAPKKKKADEPKPRGLYPDLRRKQILVVDREAASLDFTAELLR